MTFLVLVVALCIAAALGVTAWLRSSRRLSRDREARQQLIEQSRATLVRAAHELRTLVNRDRYLNRRPVDRWLNRHGGVGQVVTVRTDDLPIDAETAESITICRRMFANPHQTVDSRNERWVAAELERLSGWFDQIESYPLSARQREAVVRDEDNSLVVAGAGTGKTSTVVGKIGYMLLKKHTRPEEVLVLAFARKAKEELQERLRSRFGVELEVRTFHSLGLSILGEADGRVPTLAKTAEDDLALSRLIEHIVNSMFDDEKYKRILTEFFAYHLRPAVNECDFKSKADYYRHLRSTNLRTLKGERVRSYEELLLANWFFVNGIDYRYEAPYEIDTADSTRRQYLPDFFLPESSIYLEHFGVDRNGGTAPFVDRMRYHEQMEWKRQIHREHGTILLESYSYERSEGVLLKNLEAQLREHGVTPKPISQAQLKDAVTQTGEFRQITLLLKTFLNLFKSHPVTLDELRRSISASTDAQRCGFFLDLFQAVYDRYEAALRQEQAIDFHDMIALATARVSDGSFKSPFSCIIVDEFQDISRGRAELIQALLAQADDPRLFCVGDDWQAIYRFTGSDLSLMTKFNDFFGTTCRTDLDCTFRYNDRLAEASTAFITRNPEQLKKRLMAQRTADRPSIKVLLGTSDDTVDMPLEQALDEIATDSPNASVMILGRYNFTLEGMPPPVLSKHRHLTVQTRTVHAAKGLEADYVVVADVSAGKYGFPTEIVDDPLLSMILVAGDNFPHAEERRLFYVAMTRARHRVYILADEGSCSCFVTELESSAYASLVETEGGDFDKAMCRVCQGRLVKRRGTYGEFWGCEHFPLCSGKGVTCPLCRRGVLVTGNQGGKCNLSSCDYQASRCGKCREGYMMAREGRFGPVYGCSNYPDCTYTRDRDRGRRRSGRW